MNLKRRIVLLSLICLVTGLFLFSCDEEHGETEHVFDVQLPTASYLCTEATCSKAATYYYACSCGACGTETYSAGTSLGHTFGDYISDGNATCSTDGTKTATCIRCGEKKTTNDVNSKTGIHIYDQKREEEAYLAETITDCTTHPKYYYVCTCGRIGKETYTSENEAGHVVPESVPLGDATCLADGHREGVCSRCHELVQVVDEGTRLPHSFILEVISDETYVQGSGCETPLSYYYSCSCGTCGTESFSTGNILGHDFIYGYSNEDADCTHDGTNTFVCSRCGKKENRIDEGSRTPHSFDSFVTMDDKTHEKKCHCGWIETETHHLVLYMDQSASVDNPGYYDLICYDCGYHYTVKSSDLSSSGYTFYQYFEMTGNNSISLTEDLSDNYIFAYEIMLETWDQTDSYYLDNSLTLSYWQRYFVSVGQSDQERYTWIEGQELVKKQVSSYESGPSVSLQPYTRIYQIFLYDIEKGEYHLLRPAKNKDNGTVGFYDIVSKTFTALPENCMEGPQLVSVVKTQLKESIEMNGDAFLQLDIVSFEELTVKMSWLTSGIEQKQGFVDLPWVLSGEGQVGWGDIFTKEIVSECDELTLKQTENGISFLMNGKDVVTSTRKMESLGLFYLGHLPNESLGGSIELLKGVSIIDLGGNEIQLFPCQLSTGELGLICLADGAFYPLQQEDYFYYMNEPASRNDEIYSDDYFIHKTIDQIPGGNDWCGLASSENGLVCQYDAAAFSSYLSMKAYSRAELAQILSQYGYTVLEQNYQESEGDTISYTLAKKATLIDGQLAYLYLVILRGTGESEWPSNFNIGYYTSGFHDGFNGAADYALQGIAPYLSNETDKNYVLITGHSRGAAVGSILAAKLMESSLVLPEKLTAYVFACPTYSMRDRSYENIFVFNNPGDIVTELPLKKWGFHVEGQTILLPTSASGLANLNAELIANSYVYGSEYSSGYTGISDISPLLKLINSCFPNVSIIHEIDINELIDQLSPLLSGGTLSASAIKTIASLFFSGGNYLTKIALISYVQANQAAFSPSHQMGVYRAWITSMAM